MSRYKRIYTEVEVDVDLSEFDTEDLIDELESRRAGVEAEFGDGKELLEKIWQKRRTGQNYQGELDQLIWMGLGKIV